MYIYIYGILYMIWMLHVYLTLWVWCLCIPSSVHKSDAKYCITVHAVMTNTNTLNNHLKGSCKRKPPQKELRYVLLKVTQCLWAEPEGITAEYYGQSSGKSTHENRLFSLCQVTSNHISQTHETPSITEGQRARHTVRRWPTEREAKMDREAIICTVHFTSLCVSSELLPFPFL